MLEGPAGGTPALRVVLDALGCRPTWCGQGEAGETPALRVVLDALGCRPTWRGQGEAGETPALHALVLRILLDTPARMVIQYGMLTQVSAGPLSLTESAGRTEMCPPSGHLWRSHGDQERGLFCFPRDLHSYCGLWRPEGTTDV